MKFLLLALLLVGQMAHAQFEQDVIVADMHGNYYGIGIKWLNDDTANPEAEYVNVIFKLNPSSGEIEVIWEQKFFSYNSFGVNPQGTAAHLISYNPQNEGNGKELILIDLINRSSRAIPLQSTIAE